MYVATQWSAMGLVTVWQGDPTSRGRGCPAGKGIKDFAKIRGMGRETGPGLPKTTLSLGLSPPQSSILLLQYELFSQTTCQFDIV